MNVVPMTPITNVKLLHNVPLDSGYKDTLDFSSVSAQADYFASKTKHNLTGLGPVRMQNAIRVPIEADRMYDCNYLMFQNANFGSKWFYAFITEIKFINVNMSEVLFELDVIQSWWFDITLKPCYIEREHTFLDEIGGNLVAEPMELGDYVNETSSKTPFFDSYVAVIATAYQSSGEPTGGYYGGMFTGLNYIGGLIDNPDQVKELLDFLVTTTEANKVDSITSMFVMPTEFYTKESNPIFKRYEVAKQQTYVGNYQPKNKKLLSYPYNFLMVSTSDGGACNYRYEYFQGDTAAFVLECGMGCNPEIVLQPIAYDHQQFNIEQSLALTGFPQVGWSIDTYRAWLAQNGNANMLGAAGSALAIAGGLATMNPVAIIGGVIGAAGVVNDRLMASTKADQPRGAQGSNTLVSTREKNFYFYNRHVREDYAKIIDDYFSMYGYSIHQTKLPNIHSRPSWNYVKTRDCSLIGSVPFEDIEKIKSIFNVGVTFWHGDYVGDYTRDNSPSATLQEEVTQ